MSRVFLFKLLKKEPLLPSVDTGETFSKKAEEAAENATKLLIGLLESYRMLLDSSHSEQNLQLIWQGTSTLLQK